MIDGAAARGVEHITFGMAHRGRLNVLANVIGNLCERIFAAFEGSVHPEFPADEGDVKYHQGATGERVLATVAKSACRSRRIRAISKQSIRSSKEWSARRRIENWANAMPRANR